VIYKRPSFYSGLVTPITPSNVSFFYTSHTITSTVIASAVPWTLSIDDKESWHGFQTERQEILDAISASPYQYVLLSSNRQWSGVFEVQPSLYEFSSSPVDAYYLFSKASSKDKVLTTYLLEID
jgi:hypothetical protein